MTSEGVALIAGVVIVGIAVLIFVATQTAPIMAQLGPVSVAVPTSVFHSI